MRDTCERGIGCPYCGETISIVVDLSLPAQDYIEDCEVCCRPIVISVRVDTDGDAYVDAKAENE